MKSSLLVSAVLSAGWIGTSCTSGSAPIGRDPTMELTHVQGEMAGELTSTSVILQSRLTRGHPPFAGDVPGAPGVACFELSLQPDFEESFCTPWLEARPENDFIVKDRVEGLHQATLYFYRLLFGADRTSITPGPLRSFRTLAGREKASEASFVVVTGMNYFPFQVLYRGADRSLGFPALESIRQLRPDFFVGTGDNVYYDVPSMDGSTPERYRTAPATTRAELRAKWHEQFLQPRFVELFAHVPTYWEKDDHDYRYNDCDNTPGQAPSPDLGRSVFLEQLPLADPEDPDPKTYRTHRINRLLQIWLTEGRDYRSPHMQENGPGKTLWGQQQRSWLERTLLESDATFKILISPTPMIGPDDRHKKGSSNPGDDDFKRDNHSNPEGFSHERDEFFAWLARHGLRNFYIVCGDRHWQYHSVAPEGQEEFSCGALADSNARLGRRPGDPDSNDPDGAIRQPYIQAEASGGFLQVAVKPAGGESPATLALTWFDEKGTVLHRLTRRPRDGRGPVPGPGQ